MVDWSQVPRSPRAVALVYATVSAAWILASDRVVAGLVADPALLTRIQSVKGSAFVAGSTALIYALVRFGQRDLERTNERLDRALQQSSVLHRVLRHNLRNSANVISGNAALLSEHDAVSAADEECLDVIGRQTEHLVTITQKTRQLRDVVFDDREPHPVDLATLLATRVDAARERFPHATFETDLPERRVVETDPRLSEAVDELVENAVEHHDADSPRVAVSVREDAGGRLAIRVADDGPGMPEVERAVLEEGMESPMFHSEGLGLWIARSVAVEADGEFDIEDNDPRGTVVRLTLPG